MTDAKDPDAARCLWACHRPVHRYFRHNARPGGGRRDGNHRPTAGGWTVLGAARSLPTLSRPAALAVGGRGNVYVSDTGNHRIVEIAPDGRLLAHFGDADLAAAGGERPGGERWGHGLRRGLVPPRHPGVLSRHIDVSQAGRSPAPEGRESPLAVAVGGNGTVIVAFAPESRCTIPYGPPTCATSYIVQRRASSGTAARPVPLPHAAHALRRAPIGRHAALGCRRIGPGTSMSRPVAHEPCYKDCRVFHFLIEHAPGGRVLGHWGTDELDPTANWTAVATGGRGNVFLADNFSQRIEKRAPGGRVLARWPVGTIFPSSAGM